jgi:hypothetical protein
MSPDAQFWWNWWVQFATAVGTLAAVCVALFGSWLRSQLAAPKLRISLRSTSAHDTDVTMQVPGATSVSTKARWYHITVENDRRWATANEVQVFLLRLEEPDASGQFVATWTGNIPMKWRHGSINSSITRTVGFPETADLAALFKRGVDTTEPFLALQPIYAPSPLQGLASRTQPCRLRLTLQAKAVEADSNYLTVEIAWNGQWAEHLDVERSLVVKELNA